jgi:hypothetical protein
VAEAVEVAADILYNANMPLSTGSATSRVKPSAVLSPSLK